MEGTAFRFASLKEELEVTPGDNIELGTLMLADQIFKRTKVSEGDKEKTSAEPETKALRTNSSSTPPVRRKATDEESNALTVSGRVAGSATAYGLKVQVNLPDGKAAARALVSITGDDPETGDTMVVLEATADTN